MYREINSDPSKVPQLDGLCKFCHCTVDFKFLWFMNSRTTRRGDKYGVLSHYAYACDHCGGLLVVGHWQHDGTMSFDEYMAGLDNR